MYHTETDPDLLLRPGQAAELLGFTPRALEAWRHRGGGLLFVRVSARAVRYRRRDLLAGRRTGRLLPPLDSSP